MDQLVRNCAVFVGLSAVILCGCNSNKEAGKDDASKAGDKQQPPKDPENSLNSPQWTKKVFSGWEVELPGESTTMTLILPHGPIGICTVKFTDSDLELQTFVSPAPKEKFRSLKHFNDRYEPIVPTSNDRRTASYEDSGSRDVETNGKKGVQITYKKRNDKFSKGGPSTIEYRMFLADKVYVVAAAGNNLAKSKAVIDRFFNSLKIEANQPEFPPDDGKPIPLTFAPFEGIVEGYRCEMPGKVVSKTQSGLKIGYGYFKTVAVPIYGVDLMFGVNVFQLLKKGGSDAQYLERAKVDAPTFFAGGKLKDEKKIMIDGQEALELEIERDKGQAICRVVRAPAGNFGFEIFVEGSNLDDYRSDIERYFASFKFVPRDKKSPSK